MLGAFPTHLRAESREKQKESIDGGRFSELLRLAAMAAKWQEPARDALDKLVLGCDTNPNGVDLKSMECIEQLDYLPFDPVIKRTEGTVKEML